MNTADRRAEIINILLVRRRITAKELADEFHVTVRTIQNDIQALSLGFPIYTKQGGDGGIFVGENYKPFMNTLTTLELKVLQEMYELAEGMQKRWKFFLKTIKDNTLEFPFVIEEIQTFLEPVFDAIVNENEWQEQWNFIMKWNKNERSPKL